MVQLSTQSSRYEILFYIDGTFESVVMHSTHCGEEYVAHSSWFLLRGSIVYSNRCRSWYSVASMYMRGRRCIYFVGQCHMVVTSAHPSFRNMGIHFDPGQFFVTPKLITVQGSE